MTQQLTRRKNQIQQLFAVTNPDLKQVFSEPARSSVLKLAQKYPAAKAISEASEDDLRQTLIEAGAKAVATRKAKELKKRPLDLLTVDAPQLVRRQSWLISEAQRISLAIGELDKEIHLMLHGEPERGGPVHPYTNLLFSLPVMSDIWACTLIGVIGDVQRFKTYRKFTKYLGFAPQNSKSGTSVDKTRLQYSGVRDTHRVLFQMVLTLISGQTHNVFKAIYERRLNGPRPVSKLSVMAYICSKLAYVIYACLSTGQPYDARRHAAACGIPWDDRFAGRNQAVTGGTHEAEAELLADTVTGGHE